MKEELPNIVLVVLDTARWDHFGCYGYSRPTTPTVDSLARDGMQVETMIANGPWTLPSHGSLFTGLYPTQHGSQWQTGPRMRDEVKKTLAEWLAEQGYHTVCVTNNGLISQRTGLARGFKDYVFRLDLEQGRPRVARRVQKVLFGGDSGGRIVNAWLRDHLPEMPKPLFLFVNYLECHWSYVPPRRMERRVGGPRFGFVEGVRYRAGLARSAGAWEAIARADERQLEIYRTLYDGELANGDEHVSELLDVLRNAGQLDHGRTLFMVTSDHGEHVGEHGLADHHASVDDHLIRVPFVAWGPGLVRRQRPSSLYEFVDVFPSIARFLGREAPLAELHPRRKDLFDPNGERRDNLAFAEWRAWSDKEAARLGRRNPSYDFSGLGIDLVCVRDERFKLVRSSLGRQELYDLSGQPLEGRDCAAEHPGVVARLAAALDRTVEGWHTQGEEPAEMTDQERREIEERLSALGYI
ncbi:MAG: sulfatase-like hydrolase/transferase [Actinomycetota bacterium]